MKEGDWAGPTACHKLQRELGALPSYVRTVMMQLGLAMAAMVAAAGSRLKWVREGKVYKLKWRG